MIKATQIRTGMILLHNSRPCKVTFYKRSVTGRGSANIMVRLKNVINGQVTEVPLRSDDKMEEGYIEMKEMEFLYEDGGQYTFMDNTTFEQISIPLDDLAEVSGFLKPNTVCRIQFYEGRAIGVTPPNTVHLKVVETEPTIKGATASGNVTKPAKLETGLTIQVPLFISVGDILVVNTESGEYQGRPGRG